MTSIWITFLQNCNTSFFGWGNMRSVCALTMLASMSFSLMADMLCPIEEDPGVGLEGYLLAMQSRRFDIFCFSCIGISCTFAHAQIDT